MWGLLFSLFFLRNVNVHLLFHSTQAPAVSYENLREGEVGYPFDPEKEELLDKLKSGESRHTDACIGLNLDDMIKVQLHQKFYKGVEC